MKPLSRSPSSKRKNNLSHSLSSKGMTNLSRSLSSRRKPHSRKRNNVAKKFLNSIRNKNPTNSSSSQVESPNSTAATISNSLAAKIQDPDDLRRVFDRFDTNGDGRISSSELENMLPCLGSTNPPEEARSMMQAADLNGDGYISLEEFVSVNRMETDSARCLEDLRTAFAVFDKDGNGLISAEELHHILRGVMGEVKTTVADCKRMIRAVDGNGDGAVNFEEFMRLITRSPAA